MQRVPNPTEEEVEDAFDGNLCRCTGYRPILDAFKSFCDPAQNTEPLAVASPSPTDADLEAVYMANAAADLVVTGDRVTWHRPCTLDGLLAIKATHPQAKLVVGNTEIGVETKFRGVLFPVMVSPTMIPELNQIEETANVVNVGAAVSLTNLAERLEAICEKEPLHRCRTFKAILENLRWFAGEQIRNVSSLAGNLCNASPISDLNPVLMASGATVLLASPAGRRVVAVRDFFISYRRTCLAADEVVVSIAIPYTMSNEYIMAYKQSRRRDDDIALVNGCFRMQMQPGPRAEDGSKQFSVGLVSLAFGGMAATTIAAPKTETMLKGRQFDEALLMMATESLKSELRLPTGVPGGMPEYRQALVASLFFKFYLTVTAELKLASHDAKNEATVAPRHRPVSQNRQCWDNAASTETPVGDPLKHMAATKQSSGEAIYTDDIPSQVGELQGALVLSSKAHARIISVDPSPALRLPGVRAFYGAGDVPGHNITGPIAKDEEVFRSKLVQAMGQPIGIVVAKTRAQAQEAAKLVKVEYEELPAIVTIEEAIAAKAYFRSDHGITRGDVDAGFAAADHILEGEQRMGGQEHFYLEPNGTVAVPKGEDGEMEIFASTQNPRETQMHVAETLGVPANRIVTRVKRMGGGFGGKETRSVFVSTACAVAAHHEGAPVRCVLERDEDMVASGGRHPFLARYKVGFSKDGKVIALDIKMYSNAGFSMDLSNAVMDRALFHMDNVYNIPNLRGLGFTCKTNLVTNTAFRGFGGPQGLFFAEVWITDVAHVCNLPPNAVREKNFYKEGDSTHFNQKLDDCQLQNVWAQIHERADYEKKAAAVAQFNAENRFTKRGLAMVPTKFGISFTALFMNQAGALIQIYTDGSVLLTHGGTEMGQGLHTKMIQVCARGLGIPVEKIHITETSTNTVPNTSPTAASASSDLNGMAILNAVEKINARLAPIKEANPGLDWDGVVSQAYFARIGLSASGFYATPDLGYDFATNSGRAFNYFTFGAACAEVEIDVLTGDHQTLSSNIVMDVGSSLNPALDIGQVEGAFVQGCGLFTLEEMVYSPRGTTFTRGPGTYKIPGFKDIPVDFSVELLRNAPNERAVYSSKAVGEPPLFLGSCVYFAIKDAIAASRREFGNADPIFRLDSPATCERIRMACGDAIAQAFPPQKGDRWSVQA